MEEKDQGVSMQYKVQYLDGSNKVVRESSADTTNASEFISDKNWPSGAVGIRVLDPNGRCVLSYLTKPQGARAVDACSIVFFTRCPFKPFWSFLP